MQLLLQEDPNKDYLDLALKHSPENNVEFFIKDNEVYFNEISPRPHDTGLVTLVSQDLSEFALHVDAAKFH